MTQVKGVKFTGPTGARTESKTSPVLDIFLGSVHQYLAVGISSPKSAFP
jgi:hypothetical protein